MNQQFQLSDFNIRQLVLSRLSEYYFDTNTIAVEELDLCLGEARIDIAIVNGILSGIEIKSDKDNLRRLEKQIYIYGKIFDTVEIVVGQKHLEEAQTMVPRWWGVSVVKFSEDIKLSYKKIRESSQNLNKDPLSVAQLLWKNEALAILDKKGIQNKLRYKSRDFILHKLLDLISSEELYKFVNQSLKSRQNWRFVHQLM
ncbi:sce7726 family protein [Candidatus Berkiella cookevillensis]|uniref:Sce7726 family protein n=1 Tax=Candidatus Berkiella cookevillensis TaxID=437022 RepID=A0A0Q9Y8X1_9GAMM|nr:sce7726 family protein [Candidatus Berkiella cookevillensis]MCS5707788.1 sce7726 family protein [Candidatus Berkiella cookevillensis]